MNHDDVDVPRTEHRCPIEQRRSQVRSYTVPFSSRLASSRLVFPNMLARDDSPTETDREKTYS